MTAGRVFQGADAHIPHGPWDVIVVGAGIYGLPTAYFLARHHGARVLVLEDNAIPGECITVNTGGIIRIAYSDLDVMRVAAFARDIYRDPVACLGTREAYLAIRTGVQTLPPALFGTAPPPTGCTATVTGVTVCSL